MRVNDKRLYHLNHWHTLTTVKQCWMKAKILHLVNKEHISSRSHKAHFPMVEISSPTYIFYFSADFLLWRLWSSGLWYHVLSYQCFTGKHYLHLLSSSDSREDAVRLYRQVTEGVVNQISGKGRGDRTWSGPTANRKCILSPFPLSHIWVTPPGGPGTLLNGQRCKAIWKWWKL